MPIVSKPGGTPSGSAGGQLSGTYPNPAVAGITETSGPSALTIGNITDGQFLLRSGSQIVSSAAPTGGVNGIIQITGGVTVSHADIATALAASSSGDIVLVGPGTYAEKGLVIPDGVQLRAAHGRGNSYITGGGATTGVRITLGTGSVLSGFVIYAPTDAEPAISLPSGKIIPVVSEIILIGQGASAEGICSEANGALIDRITYNSGTIGTIIHAQGSSSTNLNQFSTFGGSATNTIRVSGGGALVAATIVTPPPAVYSCTTDLLVENAEVILIGSELRAGTNAVRITNDSAHFEARSSHLNGATYDLLIDSGISTADAIITASVFNVDKLSYPSSWVAGNNQSILAFADDKEDDEGFKIFGELNVGFAEKGKEAVFGEGDSYTRGMKVLTTDATAGAGSDGGNLTDVTAEAASASSSTFTFQGAAANYSILFCSTLDNSVDKVKHYGIKVKQTVAAVVGAGGTHESFAFEYWNGSAWVEVGVMATESDLFYRYANEVFLRANSSEHIRFGIRDNVENWVKKTIDGTEAYWFRIRIKADLSVAPVFQQFKLSPSRTEINPDGTVTHHGEARYKKTLIATGNIFGDSGVGSTNYTVGSGASPSSWTHYFPNSDLNSSGDYITFQFALPRGLCTSCPLEINFIFRADTTTTNATFTCSFLPVRREFVKVANSNGAIIPIERDIANCEVVTTNAAQTHTVSKSTVSNKLHTIKFGNQANPFNVDDFYEGDAVFVRIALDSDGNPPGLDAEAFGVEIVGVEWTPGEHL